MSRGLSNSASPSAFDPDFFDVDARRPVEKLVLICPIDMLRLAANFVGLRLKSCTVTRLLSPLPAFRGCPKPLLKCVLSSPATLPSSDEYSLELPSPRGGDDGGRETKSSLATMMASTISGFVRISASPESPADSYRRTSSSFRSRSSWRGWASLMRCSSAIAR